MCREEKHPRIYSDETIIDQEDERMTQQNKELLASLLAILPGLLSIKEDGRVLIGISNKTFTILPWLVWYNIVLGFVAIIVGFGIWKRRT